MFGRRRTQQLLLDPRIPQRVQVPDRVPSWYFQQSLSLQNDAHRLLRPSARHQRHVAVGGFAERLQKVLDRRIDLMVRAFVMIPNQGGCHGDYQDTRSL